MKQTIRTISVAIIGALALPVASFARETQDEETTVNMSDLPAEVQKTMKEKAGDSEIIRVEKENQKGKTVYDAVIKKSGKEWGLTVDENGKYLGKHSEAKEHKEKGEKHED